MLALDLGKVLAFAPHVRVEPMAGDIAFVVGERTRHVLSGWKMVADPVAQPAATAGHHVSRGIPGPVFRSYMVLV